jgi:predicted AAA+ superfamily ATPase
MPILIVPLQNQKLHALLIKDEASVEKLTGYRICPKCNQVVLKKYDKKFYNHTTLFHKEPYYINCECIIPLDVNTKVGLPDTFILLQTGGAYSKIDVKHSVDRSYDVIDSNNMYLYIFGKKSTKYINELEKLINKTINTDGLGIYNCTVDSDRDNIRINYMKMDPRDLSTLYFSNGEIDKITKFLDKFKDNEEFYREKHIKYKTGILLHGKPGTGKTSLSNAIANYYDRSILNIDISTFDRLDLPYITQAINSDTQKYVVLLEDIDTLFLNRKKENLDKEENSIVNRLLQFLDSNSSPDNVIFIATTNHLDRLDEALLRHGRFDLKVEVDEIREDEVYRFVRDFHLDDVAAAEIIEEYKRDMKDDGLFNQSAIQAYILNKLENKERDITVIDTSEVIAEKLAENENKSDNAEM